MKYVVVMILDLELRQVHKHPKWEIDVETHNCYNKCVVYENIDLQGCGW